MLPRYFTGLYHSGTENEQLTLLQLFYEVLPPCMLKLYYVSVCFCLCVVVIPQIEPEMFIRHSIHKIYVGKSKDTLDCVGVHSLGVKEVTGMFGHFIKYRVKAEHKI